MVPEPGLSPDSPTPESTPQESAAAGLPPVPPAGPSWPSAPPAGPGWPGAPAAPLGSPAQPGYPAAPGYPPPGYLWGIDPDGNPVAGPAPEQWAGYQQVAPRDPELPVEPKAFHEFYRAPRFRWWKPLAAISLMALVWFVISIALVGAAMAYDVATGRLASVFEAQTKLTPLIFAANNVTLGLFIPIAVLSSWLVYGQRPRWLSSIHGRFRWGLAVQFALIALLPLSVSLFIDGIGQLTWNPDSLFLIVTIVLTTPFQAAGEEYMARGLLARSIGSWFSVRWLGFAVATVVSSTVFMLLHVAGDPWLNLFYFSFGVTACVVTWRTGGLEAAIALHVVNNLIGEISVPFGALEHMMDRQAGVAGPGVLIQVGMVALVGAVMCWWARRRKLSTTAAPLAHFELSELS